MFKRGLIFAGLVIFSACSTTPGKNMGTPPPQAPSDVALANYVKSFNARLAKLAAFTRGALKWSDLIKDPDVQRAIKAQLAPAVALAGEASPEAAAEAETVAKAAEQGDMAPSEDATAKAALSVQETVKLKAELDATIKADRAAWESKITKLNAEWKAKLDAQRLKLWNIVAAACIGFGVLVLAAAWAISALASVVPAFGPMVAKIVGGCGGGLLLGGICLYAIGPYLHILAIMLGVCAVAGLVALGLFVSNHFHAKAMALVQPVASKV